VSASPLTATWPPAVIVRLLPLASALAAVEPVSTIESFAGAVGVEVGAGVVVVVVGMSLGFASMAVTGVPPPLMPFGPLR
jgi:hypothetical protein